MIEVSLACPAQQESPELVECFRHEGEDCPRCDGSGFRPRKHCAACGGPSGRIPEGKPLVGLRNSRGGHGPFYCVSCHPQFGHVSPEALDRMVG